MEIEELLQIRKEELSFYSPYSFLREFSPSEHFELFVKNKVQCFGESDGSFQIKIIVDNQSFVFLYEFLPWDSANLKRECFKLYTILYAQKDKGTLVKAILDFKLKLSKAGRLYCFVDLPSEDIFLIQCLNMAGMRLVETRLHFYKNIIGNEFNTRFKVREANPSDITFLKQVAANARNRFDRLHADFSFSDQEADSYLATYAEAGVQGFCDTVIVPNEPDFPVSSFFGFDYDNILSPDHSIKVSVGKLAAVEVENKGWFKKLVYEALVLSKHNNAAHFKITTQSANRPSIKTLENLSFNLGATSHILVFTI